MMHARILIVDHVIELEVFLEYLEFIDPQLQRAGLKIEAVGANSFDMAIRLLQEDSFDLIVSHYSLEGGDDGETLISRVRRREFMRGELGTPHNVPAIGTTNHGIAYLLEKLRKCGFDEVLCGALPKDMIRTIFSALKLEPPSF